MQSCITYYPRKRDDFNTFNNYLRNPFSAVIMSLIRDDFRKSNLSSSSSRRRGSRGGNGSDKIKQATKSSRSLTKKFSSASDYVKRILRSDKRKEERREESFYYSDVYSFFNIIGIAHLDQYYIDENSIFDPVRSILIFLKCIEVEFNNNYDNNNVIPIKGGDIPIKGGDILYIDSDIDNPLTLFIEKYYEKIQIITNNYPKTPGYYLGSSFIPDEYDDFPLDENFIKNKKRRK